LQNYIAEQLSECKTLILQSSTSGYVLTHSVIHLVDAELSYQKALNAKNDIRANQLKNSKLLVEKVIESLKKTVHFTVSDSHPDMAAAFRLLGQISLALGEKSLAKWYTKKALKGFLTAYGEGTNHIDILKTFLVFSEISLQQNQLPNAQDYIRKALPGLQELFGYVSKHPLLAEAWHIQSQIELKAGDDRNALEHIAMSIYMMEQTFGWNSKHPALLKTATHFLTVFLIIYFKLNNIAQAM